MGDALSDLRGESLPSDGMESDVDEVPGLGWRILGGMSSAWSSPFSVLAGFGSTVVETGGEVIINAQDTFGGAVEDVTDAANPFNLAGVAFGGVLAAAGLAVVGAFATDQVFFAGSGTMFLVSKVVRR